MPSTTEQLEKETSHLFNKFEEQTKIVTEVRLQLTQLEGRMDIIISLMKDALTNLPSAYEHGLKYDQACDRIKKIEETYVSRKEFEQFREDFQQLRKALWWVAGIFLVPIGAIAVSVIFGINL